MPSVYFEQPTFAEYAWRILRLLPFFLLGLALATPALAAPPIHDADGNTLAPEVRALFGMGTRTQRLAADRETVPTPSLTLQALSKNKWSNQRGGTERGVSEDGDNDLVLRTKLSDTSEQGYFVGNVTRNGKDIAVVSRVRLTTGAGGSITIGENLTDIILRNNHNEWLVSCGGQAPQGFALLAIVNDLSPDKKLVQASASSPDRADCHTFAIPASRAFLLSNSTGKLEQIKLVGLTCSHTLINCDAP